MAADTAIEWTDKTWNPVTGCTKVSSGCAHCYAEGVADRFWNTQYRHTVERGFIPVSAYNGDHMTGTPRKFTDVLSHPDRLNQPLRWKKPSRVFVNSMSDLFHEDVADHFIDQVFAIMALSPLHTFQVLTKRAERMRDYMLDSLRHHDVTMMMQDQEHGVAALLPANGRSFARWPLDWPLPNVWLGVSVENQYFADERIPLLLQTPAAVRFISAEPLLGRVDLYAFLTSPERDECLQILGHGAAAAPGLNWVIVGGESGPQARPCEVAWVRSIVKQCQASRVPVFIKQLGADPRDAAAERDDMCARETWPEGWIPTVGGRRVWRPDLSDRKGGDPSEWPADLRVREFPISSMHRRDAS